MDFAARHFAARHFVIQNVTMSPCFSYSFRTLKKTKTMMTSSFKEHNIRTLKKTKTIDDIII
jgi:hypothetical protein